MTERNVVLIGFMGTGKTTVGKLLAQKTGRELADVDQKIEETEKRKIADIFEKEGEAHFRRLEKEAIGRLALRTHLVITTGGGAVLDADNLSALKTNGILVLLEATPETIHQRVKDSRHRPLLKGDMQGEIARLLAERKPYYDKADMKFSTDGKTARQVADELFEKLGNEQK